MLRHAPSSTQDVLCSFLCHNHRALQSACIESKCEHVCWHAIMQLHINILERAKHSCGQHSHMSGTGETCLHPKPDLCCRLLPGKSSVRTRSSVKLSRLNARKRKHSRRRPTFLTSPGCESKGRNRCASSHSICVVLPHVQSQAVCNQELIVKFIKVCEDVAAQKKSVQAVATLCAFLIRNCA